MTACGSDSESKETKSDDHNKTETVKEQKKEKSDVYFEDDVLKIDMATIKLTGSEVIPPDSSEDKSTLIISYEFINDSDDVLQPFDVFLACFELTQETDVAVIDLDVSMADLPEKYNEMKEMASTDIKPGATVKAEMDYAIDDTTEPVKMTATQGVAGDKLGTKTYNIEQ
ncbi:DUF5067 domain-containing protein [Listeria seeligeri]|uniref:DUF5067 domain-containing protein n=1 Tax=Listeria seeligeri TaxID=1640 RepID=UPI00162537F2|nr:DUF5067 domain-containing protein [Listeria seeligeri]MBC1424635.1 DUF5067 domain-containing protein [Listeria seeligeri]MBF2655509.1 DUF5067 domain-containing protein [Listeria seeligeri]MBT0133786.1 DUF5067 domain-containing protein [Listeria seeligeri]